MNVFDLYARLSLDTDGYERGLNKAKSGVEKVSAVFSKITKATAVASTAIAAVGTAITAFGVEAAADAKAMQSQFEQTFGDMSDSANEAVQRVSKASGIVSSRLNSAATSVYAFARASGGEVAESMSIMERALQAATDAAAYYDRSLEDTTATLQSFLKGNFENDAALGLSATEFTRNAAAMDLFGKEFKELTEIQKQETLLQMVLDAQALSGAMGQAAREADGWANVQGNLTEAWKQFKAAVGAPFLEVVVPTFQNITTLITEFTASADWEKWGNLVSSSFTKGYEAVRQMIATVGELTGAIQFATGAFISFKAAMALQKAVQGFQKAQVAISLLTIEVGKANLVQAALNGTLTVGETLVALLTGKMTLATLAQGAMTKAQAALNAVLLANPIAIVVTAIGALVTALVVLYNRNDEFRAAVDTAWANIKDTISEAVSRISTFFQETIPNAGKRAVDWFKSIPAQMRTIGSNLLEGLWNGISDKVAWLKSKVAGVVDKIKSWFTGKDGFDEHSPSKWAAQVFRYVLEGGAEGLESALPKTLRTVQMTVDSLKNGLAIDPASIGFADSGMGAHARSVTAGVNRLIGSTEGDVHITVQSVLDGRILGESVTRYQRMAERSAGRIW